MLTGLDSEGCFALDCHGELVATTTLIRYSNRLAWLGMVLTRPEYRRRGFAHILVERALQFGDELGIETVKLDATDQGMPLYASFGFEPEQPVERWSAKADRSVDDIAPGAGFQVEDRSLTVAARLGLSASLDRLAFPAGRARLLSELARHGRLLTVEGGYVLHRPGRLASYIGPCVAYHSDIAGRLIASCLVTSNDRWYWDLLPEQGKTVELAKRLGFMRERRLVRMYRGSALRSRDEMVYAIAGFELG
jgi:Acetyltransferase (GNAT) domain/Acetyltransferase (GNAT) family